MQYSAIDQIIQMTSRLIYKTLFASCFHAYNCFIISLSHADRYKRIKVYTAGWWLAVQHTYTRVGRQEMF